MTVVVRENALTKPLLVTDKATWLEVRDPDGWLVFFVIFPPGQTHAVVIDRKHPEFEDTIKHFGVPLQATLPQS